jgi:hypothetical protein
LSQIFWEFSDSLLPEEGVDPPLYDPTVKRNALARNLIIMTVIAVDQVATVVTLQPNSCGIFNLLSFVLFKRNSLKDIEILLV